MKFKETKSVDRAFDYTKYNSNKSFKKFASFPLKIKSTFNTIYKYYTLICTKAYQNQKIVTQRIIRERKFFELAKFFVTFLSQLHETQWSCWRRQVHKTPSHKHTQNLVAELCQMCRNSSKSHQSTIIFITSSKIFL